MYPVSREDALPAIAARLYAGVLDASDWYAGLDAIRCATGGTWFYQFAVDMRSMGVAASLQNSAIRAEIAGGYEIDQALHDERMPLIMGMPVGQVMYDRQHITTRLSSRGLFTVTGCPPWAFGKPAGHRCATTARRGSFRPSFARRQPLRLPRSATARTLRNLHRPPVTRSE